MGANVTSKLEAARPMAIIKIVCTIVTYLTNLIGAFSLATTGANK